MRHRFFLVFRDQSGATAFEEEVTDFRALYHDVAFRAICAGARANDGMWGDMLVEPVRREGNLAGVTVRVGDLSRTYGLTVFADQVSELLVRHYAREQRELDEDRPRWEGSTIVRHADVEEEMVRRHASVRRAPYPLIERAQCSVTLPDPEPNGNRVSLLIASRLVADLKEESAASLEEERADFLTGYVVRERGGTASVVVLDRIAADADTTRSLVHFGFSAQTFAAAQRALETRGTDQVIAGWHHSHPPPCGRKCLMAVPACETDNLFFSLADRRVHRSGFNSPYMVALVNGKGGKRRADDPVLRGFGWRNGTIRARTFTVF